MTVTLCGTCRKAIFSWETPSMLPGLPPDVEWTHFIRDEEHFAVPSRSIRDRRLMCATCRQPQVYDHGWHCGNTYCPSRVDKE